MQSNPKFFEKKIIRTSWNEQEEEWYFSIVDVVGVLTEATDYQSARNYWKVLKARLKEEGFQPVTNCNQTEQPTSDCSQLPKLTAEVFDHPDCPEWAKWAAVNADGNLFFFEEKPVNNIVCGGWHVEGCKVISFFNKKKFAPSDWQNSLIERQAKLPDWCKAGEWVYLSNAKYYKIEKVDSYGIILANGIVIKTDDIHAEAVAARLRPYNDEEMKALMGKVIKKGPSMHIVTGFENVFGNECMVHVNGCLYGANDLLRQFTINNKPAGILEHLENGEWVQ
jgi:hypothetical protein